MHSELALSHAARRRRAVERDPNRTTAGRNGVLKGEKIAGTYRVTMSRAPVNAFDAEFVDAWYRVLDEVADSGCAILHVRSSEKVFSAGADLKMMRTFFAGASAGEKLVAHVKRMQDVFNRIEALPIVTLAEISGSALGGGFELALACDLRVAGHGALLGLPESRIGLVKTESSVDPGLEAEREETLRLLETVDTQSRVKAFLEGRGAR